MGSLISVIIPYCKERKYLLRCLNTIKRQTYADIEIILVSDNPQDEIEYEVKIAEGITGAIGNANGAYVYFCSSTSILAPNALEELYVNIRKEDVDLSCISIYVPNGNDYIPYFTQMSLYGKLFKKDLLEDILVDENSVYGLQEFVARYLIKCSKIQESTSAAVYETDKKVLKPEETQKFEMETWKRVFELIGTDFGQENGVGRKVNGTQKEEYEEKSMEHSMSYLKNEDDQTFFIISKMIWQIPKEKKSETVKIVEVPVEVKVPVEVEVVKEKIEHFDIDAFLNQMSGDMLINYVVGKYQRGALGLKTIIQSFIAWMKYKFYSR